LAFIALNLLPRCFTKVSNRYIAVIAPLMMLVETGIVHPQIVAAL
jgi:hypothetical protein